MKYCGLIIINRFYGEANHKVENKVSRLKEEFNLLDCDVDLLVNDGKIAYIENGEVKTSLKNYDFIIYLDKDKYLARLLEKAGFLLVNRPDFIEICDDKMLTHIALANHDIKMPKTISGPLIMEDNFDEEIINNVESQLSYPLLIKGVYGSLGLNMAYIDSRETLIKEYRKFMNQPLIFQEYISSSRGKSLRCLVVDHKIMGAIKRINPNDYRSNYPYGTYSEPFTLNDDYINMVNKIIDCLDIDYAGIDLLFGENDEPILCEINSNAFFAEFEKTTGLNIAKQFALMTLKKVKNR